MSREIRRDVYEPFWLLPSSDGSAQCPAPGEPSADRKDRQQPGATGVRGEPLKQRWSPRQISNRLRTDFPGQAEMHIVPETVYQALYGCGSLDLAVSLRSG